jgi:hypothetical protein
MVQAAFVSYSEYLIIFLSSVFKGMMPNLAGANRLVINA